jgi:two-component system response regulator AtoC
MDEQFRSAEAGAIVEVLRSTFWNRKEAAELLNVDYKAFLYKMKKLGLTRRVQA